MKKNELELYVHIPFCVKKCAYCDFLSAPAKAQERTAYVDALTAEIENKKNDSPVSTVFLGGGTPSILEGGDTARIFDALRRSFRISDSAEITMEVNPGTVTKEKAALWKDCGVTRLSIGLQSVNDRELLMLGRIHTYRDFLSTWEIVRGAGFDNINIDLISAIPGQTLKSWERTLHTAACLEPEHISAYSLIVEEGTPFYDRYGEGRDEKESRNPSHLTDSYPPLPDEDTERAIYKATQSLLAEYGFHRYEISNYAKEGYECRHNLGYWERREYLGLGLGAASLIGNKRFHNTADMEKYLSICSSFSKEAPVFSADASKRSTDRRDDTDIGNLCEDIEILSPEDEMEEFMFLGLRKTEGISCSEFADVFGRTLSDVYGPQLKKLLGQELLEITDGRVRLTERGLDISNYVFSEFIF